MTVIRRLPRVIPMIVTVGAVAVITGTASYAAQVTLNCPGTVQAGQQVATED